jgi:hypothetical protein
MTSSLQQFHNTLRNYRNSDVWLVPIPLGEKGPKTRNWPDLRIEHDDIPKYFPGVSNVGAILGEPSKWLVDIDIDRVGAIDLAERFLPATDRIFGRHGKPRSHWLYRAPGAETEKFADPTDSEMLVELRSTGTQTVFPPSMHPSKEIVAWEQRGEVGLVSPADLARACGRFATAILVRKHLPLLEAVILAQPDDTWATALGERDAKLQRAAHKWLGPPQVNGHDPGPPRSFTPASADHPYVKKAIDDELSKLRSTGKGSRNHALNNAAFSLAGWIATGATSESWIETTLLDVAREIGLVAEDGENDTLATIRSGVRAGKAQLRQIPESKHHPRHDQHEERDSAASADTLWSDPDLSVLKQGRRDAPALPIQVFGDFWAQWLKESAEGANAPADYTAAGLLAVAAATIGNTHRVYARDTWGEPSVLWCGIVGDPGSGKSPALDPVLDLVKTLEAEAAVNFEDQHRTWQTNSEMAKAVNDEWKGRVKDAAKQGRTPPPKPDQAIEPAEPQRPRLIVNDSTPEKLGELLSAHPRGLLFFRDELAGWFGAFDRYSGAGAERALWIEAFNARKHVIDRVKTKSKPITVDHLAIGVLGGIQPERFVDFINGPDDGLPSRFLWVWPEPIPPQDPRVVPNRGAALAALRRLSSLELRFDEFDKCSLRRLPLTSEAKRVFLEWHNEHHVEQGTLSGTVRSAWAKAPGHLLRLALVLEFLWWCGSAQGSPPNAVSLEAIASAAALVEDYYKPMAARVYGDAALPERDRLAAVAARWIIKTRPTLINARDFRRKANLPGLRETEKVKMALEVLVDANWLRHAPTRGGDSPGRARDDYTVNPKLRSDNHA